MTQLAGRAIAAGDDRGPSTESTIRRSVLVVGAAGAWVGVLIAREIGVGPGGGAAVANHLLFAGVACTAIAVVVPKFVAVWADTRLRWSRVAAGAAPLVATGAVGVAAGLLSGWPALLAGGGLSLAAGLWALAASTVRTLYSARPWDASERCLAVGTATLAVGSLFGIALAVGRLTTSATIGGTSVVAVASAHATLVVLGGVLTVAYGGVFQLSAMLTGAPETDLGVRLQQLTSVGHPIAVGLLAGGRLVGRPAVATVGALGVAGIAAAVGMLVGRRLWRGGESSAATRRYWGFAGSLLLWAGVTGATWVGDPLARGNVLGGAIAEGLLWGCVGFLVFGSLYHVVPFLVWLDTYAARLGLDPVPDVEDLYDRRLERTDGVAFALGVGCLAVARATASDWVAAVGVGLFTVSVVSVTVNLGLVVREHASWAPVSQRVVAVTD